MDPFAGIVEAVRQAIQQQSTLPPWAPQNPVMQPAYMQPMQMPGQPPQYIPQAWQGYGMGLGPQMQAAIFQGLQGYGRPGVPGPAPPQQPPYPPPQLAPARPKNQPPQRRAGKTAPMPMQPDEEVVEVDKDEEDEEW